MTSVLFPRLLVCGALLLSLAPPAGAQAHQQPLDPPGWVGELTGLGVNALLGGLTAGFAQMARGGSFQDGFSRGTLGGTLIYGGKRLAVERFAGAGLAGREVAAVGSSIVRNASEGRPGLERVVLPLGPVRLYVHIADGIRVTPKLDLVTALATGYAVLTPELEWDAGASLSSGAPVFRVEDRLIRSGDHEEEGAEEIGASGITRAGAIYLSDFPGLDFPEDFAHERVHLIQYDQLFWTWTSPAEDWILARMPGGERAGRHLDLNLSPLVTSGLSLAFKRYEHRPWELEAEFLARKP